MEYNVDNDDGAAVNGFISDIKTKELKFEDIYSNSINTLLANIGSFNDIFVPVVNGEKPIDIEQLEDNAPQVQDEFMEFLMKNLTAGVGIPHSFIADSENVQFAKSLTMENAKFLRAVVRLQMIFGEQFSRLVRILFKNEFGTTLNLSDDERKELEKNVKKEDKDSKDKSIKKKVEDNELNIDIEKIIVKFPSPSSLNTTNLTDQISNSEAIINFITEISVDSMEDKDVKAFKRELVKEYIPNVPWDKIEAIKKRIEIAKSKKDIKDDKDSDVGGY